MPLTKEATIRQYRADGKLGVDFDSPKTLERFLAFTRISDEPRAIYYIPILENGGIIPRDDSEFQALLDRMGIIDFDIPNILRGFFLTDFLRSERRLAMDMAWYHNTTSDRKADFRTYLEKRMRPRIGDNQKELRDKEFIKLVLLPLLRAEGEFNPYNVEIELAQRWDMTVGQMIDKLHDLWTEMTRLWKTPEVAKHLGKSQTTIKRWAKGRLYGEKGRSGHWYFTHEIIIDLEVA